MKRFLLIISLLMFRQVMFGQQSIDVTSYIFDLEISDRSDSLYGKAAITFNYPADGAPIAFDLRQPSGKVGFTVSAVRVGGQPLKFQQANDKVIVDPGDLIKKGSKATVYMIYSGIPADGLIISRNKFGKRTFFSDNWPNRAHQWIPCVDQPADKATVQFMVTSPDHYQVIANGNLLYTKPLPGQRRFTHYEEKVALPTKIMVIGVAEFATEQSGLVGSIPVSTWVFPENKTAGFKDFSIAPGILQWMQDYIGSFAFKKLANVQSKTIFGGMENAGAIFYYEDIVDGKVDEEALIAHEIAHQFFGDMVTEKDFSHVWLSEGFASYMTQLYLGSKYGTDSLNRSMAKDRDKIVAFSKTHPLPVIDTVSTLMNLLNVNSYQKGSWVLHMLRRQLGDSVFHAGMREYYRSFGGRNAGSHDLQLVFEKLARTSLDTFFHQWLEIPGQPDLDIRWTNDKATGEIAVTIKQKQDQLFSFPLKLRVESASGASKLVEINISGREKQYRLPVKDAVHLTADPDVSLLFTGKVEHIK